MTPAPDRSQPWRTSTLLRTLALSVTLAAGAQALGFQEQQGVRDDNSPPNIVAGRQPAAPLPVNPKAKLEMEPGSEYHDFGLVQQGTDLSHTFRLMSAGEEAVIISQASPSCGCLVGTIRVKAPGSDELALYELGTPIVPGSEVVILMLVDTHSKQDVTKIKIAVQTNEPRHVVMLGLDVKVEPLLRATPPFLQLGDFPKGVGRAGQIDIFTARGRKVKLTVHEARRRALPEGLSCEFAAIRPDAEGRSEHWRVTVRVSPDMKEGPGGYSLPLIADVKLPESRRIVERRAMAKAAGKSLAPQVEFYSINANMNFRVLGELEVSPQSFPMGLVHPGTSITRTVRLIAQDPDFDLSQATFELRGQRGKPLHLGEYFSTSIVPVAGMNAVEIQVTLTGLPADASGPLRGEIVIETGHPTKQQMTVPLSGVVRK